MFSSCHGKIAGQWFPPNRKKHLQKRSRPRYPIEMFPENPQGWPRVYAELPWAIAGGMQRSCMKFSQVTWCARRKRSGWVVFGGFGGWFLGAGCIRFAGLGQKFDIFSHQQSLFVGRKLKDGSFNTSTKMVVFKNSGHWRQMGRSYICYFFFFCSFGKDFGESNKYTRGKLHVPCTCGWERKTCWWRRSCTHFFTKVEAL